MELKKKKSPYYHQEFINFQVVGQDVLRCIVLQINGTCQVLDLFIEGHFAIVQTG